MILFLIGLGFKDLRDDIIDARKVRSEFSDYKLDVERARSELVKMIAELNGEIERLEQRIDDVTIRGNN